MAEDITTDTDLRPQVDAFGDFDTVSGDDNVKQQIRLAVSRGLSDIQVKPLTEDRKRKIRRRVKESLRTLDYIDTVVAVKLFTVDDETLKIDVQTQSGDISFGL